MKDRLLIRIKLKLGTCIIPMEKLISGSIKNKTLKFLRACLGYLLY